MSRTRAERRHHERRIKQKRRLYFHAFASMSPRMVGIIARTPTSCSCPMCGNQREHHGMSWQEINDRLRYTD